MTTIHNGWPEVAKPGSGPPTQPVAVAETPALAPADDPADAVPTNDTPDPVDDAEAVAAPDGPAVPPDNRATAQPPPGEVGALACLPRILDAFADEVRKRGHVGEERNAQILYLVLTSRLLAKQVSAGVKGHSASGKSATVEVALAFFPRAAYLPMTAMSERALVYSEESFTNRTLVMYEVVALREGVEDDMTSYFVRSLLSEGRIDYKVTVRGPDGGFTTKTITKKGPTNLIFTTTKTHVHAENETRVLSLNTDDSAEQTMRVFAEIANEGRCDDDPQTWRDLQQWLEDHGEHEVTIPYAPLLASLVKPLAVRMRRDFGSLLALIRAHAVLHQATRARDEGRVVATVEDYAVVRELVGSVIAEGVGATVPATVRETVQAVAATAGPDGVQAKAVGARLRLDKSNVSRRLKVAAEGGYVVNLEDRRGKPGRWTTGDPLPEAFDLLPDPATLLLGDDGGCAVAVVHGGIGGGAVQATPDELRRRPPPPARSARKDSPEDGAVPEWLEDVLGPLAVVPPDNRATAQPSGASGPCGAGCGRRIPNRYGAESTDVLCETCRADLAAKATK